MQMTANILTGMRVVASATADGEFDSPEVREPATVVLVELSRDDPTLGSLFCQVEKRYGQHVYANPWFCQGRGEGLVCLFMRGTEGLQCLSCLAAVLEST
jgi:hypothetical protein